MQLDFSKISDNRNSGYQKAQKHSFRNSINDYLFDNDEEEQTPKV